jgi:hypothetical protein
MHAILRAGLVLSVVLAAAPILVAADDTPQQRSAGATIAFDIGAQPLDRALLTYGRQANIQVLYDATLAHCQYSSAVRGTYYPQQALELLLRGTGLRVRYATANAITLAAIEPARDPVLRMQTMQVQAAPEMLDRRKLTAYAERVEDHIAQNLQGSRTIEHLAFEVTVSVWLDSEGHIARTAFIASSVDERQGQAILDIIHATPLTETPPADLPQPLRFRFRSRASFPR